MRRPYCAAVVGAGVAGASTALLLARDGHQVTLFDRAPRLEPIGAGVLLQCSGQEVLRRLGALDRVLEHSACLTELHARHCGGGDLIRTRYPDLHPDCRAYGVHRGVLFQAIFDLVRAQPVEVVLGEEIVARSGGPGRMTLEAATGRRFGPFDFIVAADGSRSHLREAFGFRARVVPYTHGTLWITAPFRAIRDRLLQVVDGNARMLGLLPLGDGLCSLYWGLPVRDFPRVRARGVDALKQEIRTFSPESGEILGPVATFDQFLLTRYQHVWMRRRHDDGAIFIGDAAHAMSPHLGQGINLAMVDAWRLAAALREAPTPPHAFRLFHARQRDYLRYYSTVTFLLSPFFQSDWGPLGWGRDLALPWLPKMPWVKRQMLLTVTGQKGGFFNGKMSV